ncbi:AMP phosphorylase [Candidatus Kuenenbacteria bacterium]|nr:AMP phosphorylase [Candidatus Kuenenbacteria bacterium]
MRLFYKCKKIDFSSGGEPTVVLQEKEAENQGIRPGDRVNLKWSKNKTMIATVDVSDSKVDYGEVGLFEEIWKKNQIDSEDIVEIMLYSRPESIKAINKKMLGKRLNYEEIYSIISDISTGKLGQIETTYYVASSFVKPYSLDELYYVTKAMAECGEKLNLKERVVDKHSIGGIPGNRTTMIVIPIIASLGLYIPKTSSRAITSPSGTADTMEVLAPVDLSVEKIKKVIEKTKACMVWGGAVSMAPADDIIIKVSKPLSLEPYDKMIISILAKKVAMGVDYLVIDLPYGPTAKVHSLKTAKEIAKKFVAVGKRFKIKVEVEMLEAKEPVGAGVGPALEARDVLRVLQQHKLRPIDLEKKGVYLSGKLLELKGFCKKGQGRKIAEQQLKSLAAWKKMQEIIKAQGGNQKIKADAVALGALNYEMHAKRDGKVVAVNNKAIEEICVNLGAPREKLAGIHMHVRINDKVAKGQKLFTLYAENEGRLKLGLVAARKNQVVKIGR